MVCTTGLGLLSQPVQTDHTRWVNAPGFGSTELNKAGMNATIETLAHPVPQERVMSENIYKGVRNSLASVLFYFIFV